MQDKEKKATSAKNEPAAKKATSSAKDNDAKNAEEATFSPDINSPRIDVSEVKKAEEATFSPDINSPRIDVSNQKKNLDKANKGEKIKNLAVEKTPKKLKNPTDLQVRLRTGFVYAIVVIASALLGNIATMVALTAAAGICAGEFFFMLRSDAKLPNETLGVLGAIAFPPTTYFFGFTGIVMTIIFLMLALLAWYIGWQRARIADVCISMFGALYTGLSMSSIVMMRASVNAGEPWGGIFVLFIFTAISLNDGMAYLFGRKFGKHRLAPHISPKKSWEGFFAGLVISSAWWCILLIFPGVKIQLWQCIVFGIVTGIAGVLGDLIESRIKRNSGVKDSGTIMPGHGGLLDRMDSVFLSGLTSAVLLFSFGCIG